jgi:hypothetical protein
MDGLFLALALSQEAAALPPEHLEFFEKKIRPVLVDRCYRCHSNASGKSKGGLLLDTKEALLRGGDSGPALVPGDPDKSLLIKAIRHADDTLLMPEKQKLPDEQIADLTAWVRLGAPDPRVAGKAAPSGPAINFAAARTFWSFKPPADVPLPDAPGARSPVDAFLLHALQAAGLRFAPEADRRSLLRRLSYDLTGLPPSAEEIEAFHADPAADAYDRAVERLLASPRYGERWGRHWLDVARYADTKEWVVDEERRLPYPWTYRDWVVRAFNEDLPYGDFLVKQLAADRLPPGDPRDLAALGFLTVGRSFLNRQPDIIDDRIDVLGRGLLGLSLGCARCHDHKYDPVSIKDYYALYGIFASSSVPKEYPLLATPKETPEYAAFKKERDTREKAISDYREKRRSELSATFRTPERIADGLLADATLHATLLKRWAAWLQSPPPLAAGLLAAPVADRDSALHLARLLLQDPAFEALLSTPEFPSNIPSTDLQGFLNGDDNAKLKKLRRSLEEMAFHAGAPARAMALEESANPHKPRVFIRGNPANPGEEVPRRFLEIFSEPGASYAGGGRLELARAIASPDHPLTARVWVNRVWAHHFGAGLVRTPSDFGLRGDKPTHPELLDWLARWFVREARGSTKELHRLLVRSAAYRQSVRDDAAARAKDPQNLLLWRANRRRLDLESMRDSVLSASGALDLAMGGPSVELDKPRRTLYGWIDRLNLANVHKVFDFPVPDMHAPQRHQTSVPQQGLWFLNAPFLLDQAKLLAARAAEGEPGARVRTLYRLLYGRDPNAAEVDRAVRFTSTASASPVEKPLPAWQYGWGTGGADFHPLAHFTGQGWQGGPKLPDPAVGWCLLSAQGGHAGNDAAHAVVRRWTAPEAGVVSISGSLVHDAKGGDGVRGRIVTGRGGERASWVAEHSSAETLLKGLAVEAGETIDFVVDCRGDVNSDSFRWAPVVAMGGREWPAESGFAGPQPPPPAPLSAWEKLAHVLLCSNEFLFLD